LNIEGTPETVTEQVEVERNGLLGEWLDKLFGPKKEVVTKTRYTGGVKGRELRYMEIVKTAENKIKLEKTREQRRNRR